MTCKMRAYSDSCIKCVGRGALELLGGGGELNYVKELKQLSAYRCYIFFWFPVSMTYGISILGATNCTQRGLHILLQE